MRACSYSRHTREEPADQILKAKSRLILLNLSDDLLLYGAQRLLLSESVNEFNVEVRTASFDRTRSLESPES